VVLAYFVDKIACLRHYSTRISRRHILRVPSVGHLRRLLRHLVVSTLLRRIAELVFLLLRRPLQNPHEFRVASAIAQSQESPSLLALLVRRVAFVVDWGDADEKEEGGVSHFER